jgi:ABC-type sugar transport system substrate-binding protein
VWVGVAAALCAILVIAGVVIANSLRTRPFQMMAGQAGTIDDVPLAGWTIVRARYALGERFVAFIACSTDNLMQITWARQVTDLAAEDGIAVRVYDSLNDGYEQIVQIERARIEGAGAIILCPITSPVLHEELNGLQAAQIPLVLLTLYDHPYGVKLDAQNDEQGYQVGDYAATVLNREFGGTGSIALFNVPDYPAIAQRVAASISAVQTLAPNATILPPLVGWLESEGRDSISDLLQSGTLPNVIITLSDPQAYGVIAVLEEADVPHDAVAIISVGGEAQAQRFIREGRYLRATSNTNQAERALLAYRGIVTMLAGETVPEFLCYPAGELLTREVLVLEQGTG